MTVSLKLLFLQLWWTRLNPYELCFTIVNWRITFAERESFYTFNASTALQKAFACDGFFKVIVPFVTFPRWNGKSLIFTPVLLLSTGELRFFKRYKKL